MVIFLRHSFVSFLILLQFAAPLLHAHTGEELTNDGMHIPGLEVVASQHSDSTTLEAMSAYEISGVIVNISSGIKRLDVLCDINTPASHISGDFFPARKHRQPVETNQIYSFLLPPGPIILVHAPRAPPY